MEFSIELFGFIKIMWMMAGKQAVGLQCIDFLPVITITDITQKTADLTLMRMITDHSKDETISSLDKVLG
jgi:hypothetical protein